MLESGSLNYHNLKVTRNLNLQHMLIQEYKQVQPQADHGCGYPKGLDVFFSRKTQLGLTLC